MYSRALSRLGTLALSLLSLSGTARAQPGPARSVAAPSPRPDFRPSRFDERWPARPSDTWPGLDALKHIPLLADDRAYLTLGGQLRVRGEDVSHYMLGAGAERADAYGGSRVLLSGDLHLGTGLRVFVEGRDAQSYSRDLPGGARPSDRDRWDLQNAFGEARWQRGTLDTRFRAGRQEIALGKERLVGVSDWANARRTFDGARATLAWRGRSVDAFVTRPVVVQQTRANRGDSTTRFRGVVLGGPAKAPRTWQLYALDVEQTRATLAAVSGPQRRVTAGGRTAGRTALPWLTYDLEGGVQRGHLAAYRVAAGFVAGELTGTWRAGPAAPSLAFGYDVSTGDRDSTDRTLGTFAPLYPAAHTHGGYADIVGRQNVTEVRAVLASAPRPWLQTRAALHRFDRTTLADAAYTKSATVLRAAAGSRDRGVGTELDLTATAAVDRHLKLLAGYAHFAPGAFLRGAPGLSHAVDWGFAGTTFTF